MNHLFPAQKKAVQVLGSIMSKYNGAVLQGGEGVGKTLMACEIASNKGKTLWVAPAKVLKDLKEKREQYASEFNISTEIDFISYNKFAMLKHLPASKLRRYKLVVFDECHMLRNYSASYTKRFVKIGNPCLFLSGTPVIKSPKDFIYVLRKCGLWKGLTTKQLYIKYFDAQPSKFGDFMEFGEFQNKTSFQSNVDLVTYKIDHEDINPDMPNFDIHFEMVEGKYEKATDITEETATRLANGLEKVPYVVPLIRKHRRTNDISTSLVLCHFHETARAIHTKLGGILALNSSEVKKAFDEVQLNGGHIVTTTGLTSSSLDLNECNQVYMVESTYSFPLDRQSINRCRRIGKEYPVSVIYYTHSEEAPVIRSFQRKDMLLSEQAHSKMGPSSLARLEQCPGSYWLPDTLSKADYIAYAAHRGTIAHGIIERYLESGEEVCETLDSKVQYAIKKLRAERAKLTHTYDKWGCEVKVNASKIHEELWGTVDFFSYDCSNKVLTVIDYKNGTHDVPVKNNLQLLTYMLMITETYDIYPEKVILKIIQNNKTKTCKYDHNVVLYAHERVSKIIDKIMAAKNNPIEHLAEGECDFFCTARKYHDQIGGQEDE